MSDAENLEIKKRARRRLVGAIALALLAAIVLPVMMEQEPRQTTADIQITIPDRNADGESSRSVVASPDGTSFPTVVPGPEEPLPAAVAVEGGQGEEGLVALEAPELAGQLEPSLVLVAGGLDGA